MEIGKFLIVVGVVIALVGVGVLVVGRLPWIGRLPGDVFIRRGNFTFYFPLATSLLLSAILTVIFYLIGRR